MKKLSGMVIAVLLSLTLLLQGVTVSADTGTGSSANPVVKPALGIRVPQTIEVNQPFTLRVVEKRTHKSQSGVSVYRIKSGAMSTLTYSDNATGFTDMMGNYAAAAANAGVLIGKTDNDGNFSYTFTESNHYIIIAIQDGFVPGFTRVHVVQAVQKHLHIAAPASATVGQQITITVMESGSQVTVPGQNKTGKAKGTEVRPVAVPGARVYAVKTDNLVNLETLRIKPNGKENSTAERYSALAKEKGFLIGETDVNGKLLYTFTENGKYMLMAVMDGFIPDFTRIAVAAASQKRLHVDAPNIVAVGQQLTVFVGEANYPPTSTVPAPSAQSLSTARFTPVANASVYAIKYNEADALNKSLERAGDNTTATVDKYISIVRESGGLLGTTNENGQLSCSFSDKGKRIIIAIKDGYRSNFTLIEITSAEKKALRLDAPESATAGQSITLTVTERIRLAPAVNPDVNQGAADPGAVSTDLSQTTQPATGQVASSSGPVSRASVYAARFKESETIIEPFTNNDGTPSVSAEKYLAQSKQWLIGTTDGNGKLVTKFADAGRYVLVAVKDGYLPGFDTIRIYQKPSPPNMPHRIPDAYKAPDTSSDNVTVISPDNSL